MADVTIVDVDGAWVNGVLFDAAELRLAAAAGYVSTGIARVSDTSLAVSVDGADQLSVQPGGVIIPGNAVSGSGVYAAGLSVAPAAVPLQARDATYGRVDLVIFRQLDSDVVGSHTAKTARVEVLTGAPSATPSPVALPLMAVELARVTVPVSGGAVASVDNSYRTYACAVGGELLAPSLARLPAAAATGQRARVLDTGATYEYSGAAWVADDTGWTAVTTTSTFPSVSTPVLQVRTIGNRAYLFGSVDRVSPGGSIPADGTGVPMNATGILAAARPSRSIRKPIGSSRAGALMMLLVDSAGILTLYNQGTVALEVNDRIDIFIDWLTD